MFAAVISKIILVIPSDLEHWFVVVVLLLYVHGK